MSKATLATILYVMIGFLTHAYYRTHRTNDVWSDDGKATISFAAGALWPVYWTSRAAFATVESFEPCSAKEPK